MNRRPGSRLPLTVLPLLAACFSAPAPADETGEVRVPASTAPAAPTIRADEIRGLDIMARILKHPLDALVQGVRRNGLGHEFGDTRVPRIRHRF